MKKSYSQFNLTYFDLFILDFGFRSFFFLSFISVFRWLPQVFFHFLLYIIIFDIILIKLIKMKNLNLLLILALVFSATAVTQQSLSISLGNRITISQGSAYKLSCSNSYGQVIYNIEGLPEGARLDGDSIILGNQARSGNFVLRVKAVDAAGNSGSQIITLSTVVVDAEEQLLEEVGRDVSNAVRV